MEKTYIEAILLHANKINTMKHILSFFVVLIFIGCTKQINKLPEKIATSPSVTESISIPGTKYTYTADNTTNFSNPERGYFVQALGWDFGPSTNLTEQYLATAKADGISMVRVYFFIPEFLTSDFTNAFLSRFTEVANIVRAQNFKMIPLFAYNYDRSVTPYNATLIQMQRHMDQLAPLIAQNTDVIAFWDAGMVGFYGEYSWTFSSYNMLNNVFGAETNTSTATFINKLLTVVPADRQIALRYSRYKTQLFGTTPITSAEAFANNARGRIGFKNDCFLCSNAGSGNYFDETAEKYFEATESKYLIYAAEAEVSSPKGVYDCTTAQAELSRMHMSTIHNGYNLTVIKKWKQQGCYNTIARNLGYRFRLTESIIPASQARGTNLQLGFTVTNDGYASCYNARKVQVILRNNSTGVKTVVDVSTAIQNNDPRFWLPGELHDVVVNYTIPATLATGAYTVLLNLPDPYASLTNIPGYAIRMANTNIYETSTGYNILGPLTVY